jgi:hypothetical protein
VLGGGAEVITMKDSPNGECCSAQQSTLPMDIRHRVRMLVNYQMQVRVPKRTKADSAHEREQSFGLRTFRDRPPRTSYEEFSSTENSRRSLPSGCQYRISGFRCVIIDRRAAGHHGVHDPER